MAPIMFIQSKNKFNLYCIPLVNYADNNTPYCTGLKISDFLYKLKNATKTLYNSLKITEWRRAPEKYIINNTEESLQIKTGNEIVSNSKYERLLGLK